MKPIKLTISAFGPFADLIEIDFARFERDGLFLLSGETGAGKTTIFDAICFALFGEVSGGTRGTDNLRSDFAAPETATFVELDFEHSGNVYKIRRNPEYTRPKMRGEGVTTAIAAVELYLPERSAPLTKTREADAAVEELLSVTYEQFKQIMMLAQGEFLALITAESRERTDIMRRVFGTGVYAGLQLRLQRLASGLKAERDGIFAEVRRLEESYVADIDYSPERLSELANRRGNVKTQLDALLVKIEQANSLNATLRALTENRAKLSKAEDSARNTKESLDKLTAGEPRVEQLKRDIADIETALPKYAEYTAKTKALAVKNGKLSENKAALAKLTERTGTAKAEITALRTALETLKNAQTEAVEAKNALDASEKRAAQLRELKSACDNREKKNAAYIRAQKAYFAARKLYDDSIAGRLAAGLRDGEPCPVCGSTEHPQKARARDDAPTQAQFEEIERGYTKALADSGAAAAKSDALSAELGIAAENAAAAIAEQAAQVAERESERRSAEEAVEKYNKAREREKQLAAWVETNAGSAKTLEAAISAQNTEVEVVKTEIANIKAGLKHADEKAATAAHRAMSEELDAMRNALRQATERYQSLREQIASLTALADSGAVTARELAEKLAVQCEIVDLSEYEARKAALTAESSELEQAEHTAKSAKVKNEQIAAQLNESRGKLRSLEKRCGDVDLLYRTASGNLSGKSKLQFETYVQQVYFDMVLSEANKRFGAMTDGRYELLRQGAGKIQGKAGLDIDVFDNWSQKIRPAKTLSGGESFKAALSLALGLSDVVQSYSGGIKIDAMFIDEGFGSLDSESLDNAMDVIASLADGSRLVGIISHVDALKERIPNKISVERDKTGSTIRHIPPAFA